MLKMATISVPGQRNRAALAGAVVSFMACLAGIADPGGVADTAAGTYTLDYDTAYTVTADDATAAEGLDIVKKGSGTVTAGADLASFAGEIRIEEGIWFVNDLGGLGTGAGGTVVSNGAALHFNYSGRNILKFAAGESLTIVGTGPDGKGALYNASAGATSPYEQSKLLSAGNCKFELSGNATVGGNYSFGLGGGTVRLNGHKLTLAMKNCDPFNFTCGEVETAGDILVKKGRFFLDGSTVWGGCDTNVIQTAATSDSQIAFRSVLNPVPYKLLLAKNSRLYPSSPKPFSTKYNVWAGPVELSGTSVLSYNGEEATGVTLAGRVSGSGSISVSSVCKLRLTCPTNNFSGSVTVKNGAILFVAADGAIPANGGGISGEAGSTVVMLGGDMSLPASTFSGGVVSNAVAGSKVSFAGITKTGEDTTLTLVGGIEATNADVQAGDIKFGRIVPVGEDGGVYMWSTNFADQATMKAWWPASKGPSDKNSTDADWLSAANKLKSEVEPELVDYPVFAYSTWPAGWQFYVADGYFRSSEPTNAVFTFTTSIADMAAVWIDGTCILRRGSSANMPSGLGESSSTYFVTSGTLTLAPGPHQFLFVAGHYNSSGRGPRAQALGNAGLDWAAKFGIGWRLGKDEPEEAYPNAVLGVVVHSSNYTAVSNTADAVVITPGAYYTAAEVAAKPGRYVPTFASATFANGTALDLGDVAPYCGAAAIGNLTGTPTVANGLLSLSGLWTPTAEGLAVQPLTLDAAELSFGDGAAVSHPVRPAGAVRVAYAPDGSSITNAPSLAEGMEYLYRKSAVQDAGEGATSLDLLPFVGIRIGIR